MNSDLRSLRPSDSSAPPVFVVPTLTEWSSLIGNGIRRPDREQQHNSVPRRSSKRTASQREEEVVAKLMVEISQFNGVARRAT